FQQPQTHRSVSGIRESPGGHNADSSLAVGHQASHARELGLHGKSQIPFERIEAKNRIRQVFSSHPMRRGWQMTCECGKASALSSIDPAPTAGICDSGVVPANSPRDLTMATRQPNGPAVEASGLALGITAAAGLILMLVGVFGM